ncbi:MAG: UDP-N-acetylmuramate--L-alanine ligase [Deltaproteobacteria bacterium]|nr:UDP-N-acetylmuramate--L-alanine ligase [Deltaproteobacteria bacterium]MCL5277847.1 UDP-N-acetylmuramate--L-alanine ligase [Deltaproteobacteria bacterium]
MHKRIKHIHFVGIGGAGMSGIAELLINIGYDVSGSDVKASKVTERLRSLGARIMIGHRAENADGAHVVVFSSAVRHDNPELLYAREHNIPSIPRAEMLAELMRVKYAIAIAGSHGKTTTTSLVSVILVSGGLDPTSIVGGKVNMFGSNAKLGQSEYLVAEADESDGSFLRLTPTIAVVTNIDPEHLDYYKTFDREKDAYVEFVNKVPFYGLAILCLDEENVASILPRLNVRRMTYGLSSHADVRGYDVAQRQGEADFSVMVRGRHYGSFTVHMPGIHNVYNALAGVAAGVELEIDPEKIREGVRGFNGVERRFQIKAHIKDDAHDVIVVDDYGHHPKEIKATLAGAKSGWNRRLIVVFQPHRYTRTMLLFNDFLTAFYQADVLIVTDIYPAGEEPIEGVSAYGLFSRMKDMGYKDVRYIRDRDRILDELEAVVRPGDMVITQGAGDVTTIGDSFIKRLRKNG